jgi:hypothetical protein
MSNSMKILPMGAELFHADGHRQTDKYDKVNSFRNFTNALINGSRT